MVSWAGKSSRGAVGRMEGRWVQQGGQVEEVGGWAAGHQVRAACMWSKTGQMEAVWGHDIRRGSGGNSRRS